MNKKFYIFLCVFLTNFLSIDVFANNLDNLLLQYCVPREGSCINKATYSNGKCVCSGKSLYIDRECYAPKCPSGTYIYYRNDTDSCGAGNSRTKMKN
ncbi:MAG: hypothetical protein ACI4N3_00750 [Alphaproteobacteria bacterium]